MIYQLETHPTPHKVFQELFGSILENLLFFLDFKHFHRYMFTPRDKPVTIKTFRPDCQRSIALPHFSCPFTPLPRPRRSAAAAAGTRVGDEVRRLWPLPRPPHLTRTYPLYNASPDPHQPPTPPTTRQPDPDAHKLHFIQQTPTLNSTPRPTTASQTHLIHSFALQNKTQIMIINACCPNSHSDKHTRSCIDTRCFLLLDHTPKTFCWTILVGRKIFVWV